MGAPDPVQLLTALTTEHFTLQGARSQTMSETSARASIYMFSVSSVVALGFVSQVADGAGAVFDVFALTVLPVIYFLGCVTYVRLVECGAEDLRYGMAINRIRGYYKELAEDRADLFLLSGHDDAAGVFLNMGIAPDRRSPVFAFSTAIAVVNGVVGGAVAALALGCHPGFPVLGGHGGRRDRRGGVDRRLGTTRRPHPRCGRPPGHTPLPVTVTTALAVAGLTLTRLRQPARLPPRRSRGGAAGEGAGETADERRGERAVSVERRIENRQLDPDDEPGRHGESDDRLQFSPAQPAGQPVIHGRHDGIIEGIAVDVDPEAVELGRNQALESVRRSSLHSQPAQCRKVDDRDGGVLDALAAGPGRLLRIPPRELDDVFVADQRAATLEVGHDVRTPAGGQGQIHGRGLAVGLGVRLVEVGVAIDEQQPVTPAPPQGQEAAKQNRAIPAEHERDVPDSQDLTDGVRQGVRVVP
jgi:hypothetical protein